jgi:hypothetical protein
MLSNPLNRVMFRSKALDYFRFAIGPQNIDPPARTGIFPRHENWSLLGHPTNMGVWRPGSSQLSCNNQADHYPGDGSIAGRWCGFGICGLHVCRSIGASESLDWNLPCGDSGNAKARLECSPMT